MNENEKHKDDGFWDLSDKYIPKKTVIPPKRDISSISISVGEDEKSTISPQPIVRKETSEVKIDLIVIERRSRVCCRM